MSRLQCLKVLPLRCVRKKKSEQIIRIYAGFYQFIGALVEYCLYKSRPGVQTGFISVLFV